MVFPPHRTLLVPVLATLVACQPGIPQKETWSGHALVADGRRVPFTLELDLASDPPTASFLNGSEQTPVPIVEVRGDSVILGVPEYDAAFLFAWDGTVLQGVYERYRSDTTGFPVQARPGPPPFGAPTMPAIALTGSFRVMRETSTGVDSSSSAVFWTRGDSVYGTVVAPSGDDGLFAGRQEGDTVRLARFTGWQCIYLELVREGTSWNGLRFVRQNTPSAFRLEPRPNAEPTTPTGEEARPIKGLRTFVFRGVTPDGDTLSHEDPRFTDKALIVDIMGTWCHNCLDGAPVLQDIYQQYRDDGLEIVSLSFELRDDLDAGLKNLRIFRDRHGLTYTLLYAGDISRENVAAQIGSQIENFGAYPTAIFIDRTGRIIGIHTGFRGPGTGDGYQQEVEYFFGMAERLTQD